MAHLTRQTMRICHIADANSIHTHRWLAPALERGDQIHLISFTRVERSWQGLSELIDLTRRCTIPKVRFAYWGWWLRQYVRRTHPDILHAHQLTGAGWLGAMAGYHPFVVTGWGSDILVEPHRSALRRFLLKIVLRRSDRLTVPSRLMYDAARNLGVDETRLRLIPWGIETDLFTPTPRDGSSTRSQLGIDAAARVILSPRKIKQVYNIDLLLKAADAIKSQVPGLRLVLIEAAAEPGYLAELNQLIQHLGLQQTVLWLPRQESMSQMARLYRMADVVASIPSSEGYGFSVYEAMASGCPTLISDLPVFKEELTDRMHTVKVPVGDLDRTSQALVELLTNVDLRETIQRNALGACPERSVTTRAEQTEELYRELVEQPRHKHS
jgi:glycosyltransferase involved in cell wall biosynthesis